MTGIKFLPLLIIVKSFFPCLLLFLGEFQVFKERMLFGRKRRHFFKTERSLLNDITPVQILRPLAKLPGYRLLLLPNHSPTFKLAGIVSPGFAFKIKEKKKDPFSRKPIMNTWKLRKIDRCK